MKLIDFLNESDFLLRKNIEVFENPSVDLITRKAFLKRDWDKRADYLRAGIGSDNNLYIANSIYLMHDNFVEEMEGTNKIRIMVEASASWPNRVDIEWIREKDINNNNNNVIKRTIICSRKNPSWIFYIRTRDEDGIDTKKFIEIQNGKKEVKTDETF